MALVKPVASPDQSAPPPEPHDRATLLAELGDDSPAVRRRAAHDLAGTGAPWAVAALCARAGVEVDDTVRESILTVMMGCRSRATVEGLLPYLASPNPSLRNGVVDVLRVMAEAVGPHVDGILRNQDAAVRLMGIDLLVGLHDARVPAWLVGVIERDDDLNVCAAAVDALAEIGEPAAVPALKAVLERFPAVPFLEFAVRTAIARIGNSKGGA